jgi:hypothetical protein
MPNDHEVFSEIPTAPIGVLDLAQLRLIEAVHRGFLYQHLYAVGCLLRLAIAGGRAVSVERDEDVEVAFQDSLLYFQIKTRTLVLQRSDISGALRRFEEIRRSHVSGSRPGIARFRIVSNVPPHATLMSDLISEDWPADVQIKWPGSSTGQQDEHLPPAWPDLSAAIAWCIEAALAVPFAAIAPETLVWKLAARVHYAATGSDQDRPSHTFKVADLPALFEQIVEQLQEFPSVPDDYRPQANEPSLDAQTRVRIVTGLSGSGKTAWAAQVARHCAAPIAYFDVADLPGSAIASSLARELVARFLSGRGGAVGAAILPAASGLEMLRALDRRLEVVPAPIVVIDNAHRVAPRDLFEITGACSRFRFVFLTQPWAGLTEAEALFNERAEWLSGWGTDAVAAEFAKANCTIDPATADRWRTITAGMPLFVKNAALLAANLCGGDAARFANEVNVGAHSSATAQETILERVVDALCVDAKMALATLSLSLAPISRDEADLILGVLPQPSAPWGHALRELTACGGLQVFADGRLKVHDALRMLGRTLQSDLPPGILLAAQTKLRDLLLSSLEKHHDLVRFGMWLRLLPMTGKFETLVDIATQEYFHEVGDPADLKAVLEAAVSADELDDKGKFWTLDALAFWDWQSGERGEGFSARISQMMALIEKGTLGDRERVSLVMKQMPRAAANGNVEGVMVAFRDAKRQCHNDLMLTRLVRYNYAGALFHLGRYHDAEREAELLYEEYYKILGLDPTDVIGVNPQQIIKILGGKLSDHQDDLKHLADCLALYAMSRSEQGLSSGLARLHALKFYTIAGAYRSAVKIGQEAVDDFIAHQDPEGARQIMEGQLLPLVREYRLTSNMVPVRAQYAVILAYCGNGKAALQEMQQLQPFAASLRPEAQRELRNQVELIKAINLGLVERPFPVRERFSVPERTPPRKIIKVGRNDPCPCGSGKKYKKCCLC